MAQETQQSSDDHKVRRNLAYYWSGVATLFLAYACFNWADGHPEIQTLLMGFMLGSGITGLIMGAYFNNLPANKAATTAGTTSADISASVNISPASPDNTPS